MALVVGRKTEGVCLEPSAHLPKDVAAVAAVQTAVVDVVVAVGTNVEEGGSQRDHQRGTLLYTHAGYLHKVRVVVAADVGDFQAPVVDAEKNLVGNLCENSWLPYVIPADLAGSGAVALL